MNIDIYMYLKTKEKNTEKIPHLNKHTKEVILIEHISN